MATRSDDLPGVPINEIEDFLRSGQHDIAFRTWPGENFLVRAQFGNAALRRALVSAVRERTQHATLPEVLTIMDTVAFTRGKVTPMVRGLFPAAEQERVLDTLARSVVFLTPATIDGVLEKTPWLSTAWDLANLYLADYDAELLADDAPYFAGLSEGTTCYLSAGYFDQSGCFDDFLVHEAAHIFHNCKRVTIGLPETRRKEWLLEIDYGMRETFAYACEAYSRIRELSDSSKGRLRLLAEHEQGPMPPDERVNVDEYMDILREAVTARNGWKRILQRCSPPGSCKLQTSPTKPA
jgi:hypothetical protein